MAMTEDRGNIENVGFNSSSPFSLKAVGDDLHFSADNGVTGSELWKSDGTEEGTVLVKDILDGVSGSELSILGGSNL